MNKKYALPAFATLLLAISVLSSWSLLQRGSHLMDFAIPTDNTEPTFSEFLGEFPSGRLPFAISVETLRQDLLAGIETQHDEEADINPVYKRLGYRYAGILPALDRTRFSRSPEYIEPVMAFSTRQGHAVVYKFVRAYNNLYCYYGVTSYDPDGVILNEQTFASRGPQTLMSGALDADFVLTNANYDLMWEKPTEDGYTQDNTIAGTIKKDESTVNMKEKVEAFEKHRRKKKNTRTRPEPALLEPETAING